MTLLDKTPFINEICISPEGKFRKTQENSGSFRKLRKIQDPEGKPKDPEGSFRNTKG
jgi:hypothetical protein